MSSPHQSVPPAKSSHTSAAGSDTGSSSVPSPPKSDARTLQINRLIAIGIVALAYLALLIFASWPLGVRIGAAVPAAAVCWLLWPKAKAVPTPGQYVIRIPQLGYIGVLVLTFCVFFAFVGWPVALWPLLLLPVAAAVFVARTQTVVSERGLALRSVFGAKELAWSQVKGVSIPKRGYVRAHLTDDSVVSLPAVSYDRLRDLIDASGGRIPDLFAAAEEAEDRAAREAAAAAPEESATEEPAAADAEAPDKD